MNRMDPTDVIYISDTESNASSIVLVKLPLNEIKKAPVSDTCQRSSLSQNNEEADVVTLSSVSHKSTERCPVTWSESAKKSNLQFLNSDSFYSPSPRAKVTHWLTENASRCTGTRLNQQEGSTEPQSNVKESPLDSVTSFSTNKSSILVRQDYKKSDLPEINFAVKNSVVSNVNMGNNRIIYLENRSDRTTAVFNKFLLVEDHNVCNRSFLDNANMVQKSNKGNKQQTFEDEQIDVDVEGIPSSIPLSVKSLVESMPSLCQTTNSSDSNLKLEAKGKVKPCPSMPPSPEAQKKIELCQYLKLMDMNPSDTKSSGMTLNRRSTRVKHLALMSEKRELERKLISEMQEEKKKSLKILDADSRNSSENDRGSKLSKKSNLSTISSNTSKTPSRTSSPTLKASTEDNKVKNGTKVLERRNSVKTPSKFLQVPEVSTTSISKSKHFTGLQNSMQMTNANGAQRIQEHGFSNAKALFRKSDSDAVVHAKEDSSTNSCKSEIITKKSFEQLCINVESLKSLHNMRSQSTDSFQESTSTVGSALSFSLVKSVANIPNTHSDFDDTIESVLHEDIVKKIRAPESIRGTPKLTPIKRNSDSTALNTNVEGNVNKNKKSSFLQKRKRKISDMPPKPKVPKLDLPLRPSSKPKRKEVKKLHNNSNRRNTRIGQKGQRRKKYPNPQLMNRLRSRKRLKQIELKKILLKETKKRVTKAKLKQKLQLQQKFIQQKNFKTAELIQYGCENNPNAVKELTNRQPLKQSENVDKAEKPENLPTKAPLSKIKKRLPEAEIWRKYFTSEHRKAYIESIKYLEDEENAKKAPPDSIKKDSSQEAPHSVGVEQEKAQNIDEQDEQNSPPCLGFKTTEIKEDKLHKLNQTCENIEKSITPIPCSIVALSNHSFVDKNRPSSEDLEVDNLMSGKRMKDQATQKDCKSPSVGRDTLQTDMTDPALADHSRCTSSSDPSTANSWSLQTVESNPDPMTSTSRQEPIEVPCRSHTPPTTRMSATSLYQPEDTSSRFSMGVPEVVNISQIQPATCTYVPLTSNGTEVKSLHHCLTQPKTKPRDRSRNNSPINQQDWEESLGIDKSPRTDRKISQSHTIYLSNTNGAVMNAYYLDYHLVIVQELMVSFWNQSPLGNVLGAQDMWIPKGNTRRMVLGSGSVHKVSAETVISFDNTIAYIELWTKEHKSDKRERPVADIFIVIYLRLSRGGPDKKVLQLENIHGYASDVQYIVLRNARSIIVSWSVIEDGISSTLVHCYHLSPDYQMVTSITKMQTVGHYVSSLHNIEDCDTLILGCGDDKITVWDLEDGYVVATIDLIEIQPQPRTVWAKRDRGFLFTLHHFADGVLQLIAINSFDSTWKRLQTYKPEIDYENLLGVCLENGLLVAFYDTGVSCWSVQTGIPVLEDTSEDGGVLLPYGKHVAVVLNNQVHVRHALEYLITICPVEDS